MNIEMFLSILSILFIIGFFVGYKRFLVPKCIQKLFTVIINEFAASTDTFTVKDLVKILDQNVETAEITSDKEELLKCIKTVYTALKRELPENLPDDLNKLKEILAKAVIELFVTRGILVDAGNGRYRVQNVLNMLTEKHYNEARSVTRNDDILYGAYQVRHITSIKAVIIEFLPLFTAFLLAVIFPWLNQVYPNSIYGEILEKLNPWDVPTPLWSIFVLAVGILLKDVIDNVIKAYYREMYRVVVGRKSGIRYDLTYDDRLSGNIRRRLVAKSNVDLEQTMRQRMFSRFSSIPVGNIKIRMPKNDALRRENPGLIDEAIYVAVDCMEELGIKGKITEEDAKKIEECAKKKSRKAKVLKWKDFMEIFEERPHYLIRKFRNMPYPNEMFKAIKTIQLGHIYRRMKHADKILMRKGGAVASFNTRRKR